MEVFAIDNGVKWLAATPLNLSGTDQAGVDVIPKFGDDDEVVDGNLLPIPFRPVEQFDLSQSCPVHGVDPSTFQSRWSPFVCDPRGQDADLVTFPEGPPRQFHELPAGAARS